MGRAIDMTGHRFGRLIAVRALGRVSGGTRWLFRCDCGIEHEADGALVRRGITRSCGCLRDELSRTPACQQTRHASYLARKRRQAA